MSGAAVPKMELARDALAKGKLGEASGYLGDAVYGTRDPRVLLEMREMAQEGFERSGFFSRGEWKRILKAVDKKLGPMTPKQETLEATP